MKEAFEDLYEKDVAAGMLLQALWHARTFLSIEELAKELAKGLRAEEREAFIRELDKIKSL